MAGALWSVQGDNQRVTCQWLIPTHEELKVQWPGSEDPLARTSPLWPLGACQSKRRIWIR